MRKALFILIFLTLFLGFSSNGQEKYPSDYFRPPLNITLKLSGTFGELRSDHFHAGIDIRTNEEEGYKIYAIADAYVSRIKVSPGGYGKALYLTHPNGYVSVYGHLQSYNISIDKFVKQKQYEKKSYAIDLYLSPNDLAFKKGEIIGYTGNSGSSGGPHLHFEIRDELSQKPINPLHFGFEVEDKNKPLINLLKIYPACPGNEFQKTSKGKECYVKSAGGIYKLNGTDTITFSGQVYLGIHTYDPFNNGLNKNGVYSISMYIDSTLHYSHSVETFSFAESRYINSFIDYGEYKRNKRRVQKAYIQPNNKLSIYKDVLNKGLIQFTDTKTHLIEFVVSDIKGNTSLLRFYLKSDAINCSNMTYMEEDDIIFSFDKENIYKTDQIEFVIPEYALYDNLNFEYLVTPSTYESLSDVHHIHNKETPLHKYCEIAIKTKLLPPNLSNKAFIAKIDKNKDPGYFGGKWKDGFIRSKTREFGNYCILVDTIKPKINPKNIANEKDISNQKNIKIQITDELSGIKSYRGSLNGKWILMEYDAKNDLLIYHFDDRLQKGTNEFELIITDNRNNITKYKANLVFNQ